MNVEFPALALAARRLGLDAGELGECVLHAMDCGWDETEAIRMNIVEVLQRRGAYHGRLKQAIDDGTIFQMSEDGGHDRRGTRRMGRRSIGPDSSSLSPGNVRAAVDDGQRSGRLSGCAGRGPASFE
jgi:hypothetical protein